MSASLVRSDEEMPVRSGWWESLCDLAQQYDNQHFFFYLGPFDDTTARALAWAIIQAQRETPGWFGDTYMPDQTSKQKAMAILSFVRKGAFEVHS